MTEHRHGTVRRLAAVLALLGVVGSAGAAHAFEWSRVQGHASFGYGRLMIDHPTVGSIGVTVGADYPVRAGLDVGVDLALYLYGNRTVDRGSLNATLDYATQSVTVLTHWAVPHGPISRISIGPGLTHTRAELSAAAGGAQFLDLATDDVVPSAALDLTIVRRKPAPVRVALILGSLVAFRKGEDWSQFSVRLGFHY